MMAASNSGRQRPLSISSMRRRKRPPLSRAARQPRRAERTWPRCSRPVGLGAKRVTDIPAPSGQTAGGGRLTGTDFSIACRPPPAIGSAMPMSRESSLSGPSVPPRDGRARMLVVLLHGWGADGNDLIGLAPSLRQTLPGARFVAPDGPEPCDQNPMGRQWFSFLDRNPEVLERGRPARRGIDRWLSRRGTGTPRARRHKARARRIQSGRDDGAPCRPAPVAPARRRGRLFRHADRSGPSRLGDPQPSSDPAVPWRRRSGRALCVAARRGGKAQPP